MKHGSWRGWAGRVDLGAGGGRVCLQDAARRDGADAGDDDAPETFGSVREPNPSLGRGRREARGGTVEAVDPIGW